MLLDLIYPKKCIFCKEIVNKAKVYDYICRQCTSEVDFLSKYRVCELCGVKINLKNEDKLCLTCQSNKRYFDKGRAVFLYNSEIKKIIFQFKYFNKRYLARSLSSTMISFLEENKIDLDFDYIIPVPIYKDKLKEKGFNHAELLSAFISEHFNLLHPNDLISRNRDTTRQSALRYDDRIKNLEFAFSVNKDYNLEGKSIIIIDDIFTTGTTINEMAKVLKQHGCINIDFFSLSIVERPEKHEIEEKTIDF